MAGVVSKSYCDAIFSLAQEEGKLDLYKEQLDLVAENVKQDANYRAVMAHPKISKEEKKELLVKVYGNILDPMLLNFLKLLVDKGRFRFLEEITKEYTKEYNKVNNIQVVYVKSATSLSEEEVSRLKATLEKKLNKKVDFVLSVDSDLIAGIRMKINDQIIDNSARGKLERLKESVQNLS